MLSENKRSRPVLLVGLMVLIGSLSFIGCSNTFDQPSGTLVELVPGDTTNGKRLRWSPKGETIMLTFDGQDLVGQHHLGSEGTPSFAVRLSKSENASYFDQLWIDANRNGMVESEEQLTTEPSETRYKMWSSFETTLQISVVDSVSGEGTLNPYPLSLWYVEDLREPQTEYALRFSRKGWMEGSVDLGGETALVRISESLMDGLFSWEDEWTLATTDSVHQLYAFQSNRPARRHAWLGEKAFKIIEISPNGRSLRLEPTDPGVTRTQELLDDDQLAVDRQAPHSGGSIAFRTEFEAAEAEAKRTGKTLFIDFETVWCGPCKTMEEWVYTADSVVLEAENLVSVKVDGDDFPEIVKRFDVVAYPTMIKMNPDGEVVGKLVGYQGVEAMTAFLATPN